MGELSFILQLDFSLELKIIVPIFTVLESVCKISQQSCGKRVPLQREELNQRLPAVSASNVKNDSSDVSTSFDERFLPVLIVLHFMALSTRYLAETGRWLREWGYLHDPPSFPQLRRDGRKRTVIARAMSSHDCIPRDSSDPNHNPNPNRSRSRSRRGVYLLFEALKATILEAEC